MCSAWLLTSCSTGNNETRLLLLFPAKLDPSCRKTSLYYCMRSHLYRKSSKVAFRNQRSVCLLLVIDCSLPAVARFSRSVHRFSSRTVRGMTPHFQEPFRPRPNTWGNSISRKNFDFCSRNKGAGSMLSCSFSLEGIRRTSCTDDFWLIRQKTATINTVLQQ